jgi:hypothetical protein
MNHPAIAAIAGTARWKSPSLTLGLMMAGLLWANTLPAQTPTLVVPSAAPPPVGSAGPGQPSAATPAAAITKQPPVAGAAAPVGPGHKPATALGPPETPGQAPAMTAPPPPAVSQVLDVIISEVAENAVYVSERRFRINPDTVIFGLNGQPAKIHDLSKGMRAAMVVQFLPQHDPLCMEIRVKQPPLPVQSPSAPGAPVSRPKSKP